MCNYSFGEAEKVLKEIKKNKDIARGFNKVDEYGKKNKWRVVNKKILKSDKNKRKHILQIVDKSKGHPVRLGKQSIRFELRHGDCGITPSGYNDCTIWNKESGHYSERHELGSVDYLPSKGITWHTYSFFIPEDFPILNH